MSCSRILETNMEAIDFKKEKRINPGFFEQFKKLWVFVTEDSSVLRIRQFNTKMSAIIYARKQGVLEYKLHQRKRSQLKTPWDALEDKEPKQKDAKSVPLPQVNPFGEIICCLQCGRDTTRKHGYCPKCNPNSKFHVEQIDDRKDRPVNPMAAGNL